MIFFGGNVYIFCCMVVCLCDMEIILCYVIYFVFIGDFFVMEDCCLNGLCEIYLVFGIFGVLVVVGVNLMKEVVLVFVNDKVGILVGDCVFLSSEIGIYFDKVVVFVVWLMCWFDVLFFLINENFFYWSCCSSWFLGMFFE